MTEAVRRNPYSVLLFDEIEKAHRDFSDIMLQILDDGRLTDTQGRTVNFKNCVVFATSNLPSHHGFFKNEMIGRLDDILYFNHLNDSTIYTLLDRELESLNEKLSGREVVLSLSKEFKAQIKNAGFDEKYGARPLKNAFNRMVIKPLSQILLQQPKITGEFELERREGGQLQMIEKAD